MQCYLNKTTPLCDDGLESGNLVGVKGTLWWFNWDFIEMLRGSNLSQPGRCLAAGSTFGGLDPDWNRVEGHKDEDGVFDVRVAAGKLSTGRLAEGRIVHGQICFRRGPLNLWKGIGSDSGQFVMCDLDQVDSWPEFHRQTEVTAEAGDYNLEYGTSFFNKVHTEDNSIQKPGFSQKPFLFRKSLQKPLPKINQKPITANFARIGLLTPELTMGAFVSPCLQL
ncbi:hypothetical protein B0H16DRAFT_1475684 [Mycena metata]|uniref:Uncharacterized protein n=1 Tax=Mycena metata TaxID=1033252 RepID=A0AAD7HE48_9AGAR|nr:hypothetical protein B0H16DRAFT_1475684 [Mycena metata]